MSTVRLRVVKQTGNQHAVSNYAYTDFGTFQTLYTAAHPKAKTGAIPGQPPGVRCEIGDLIINICGLNDLEPGCLACSLALRNSARLALDRDVTIRPWSNPTTIDTLVAASISITLSLLVKDAWATVSDAATDVWLKETLNGHVLTIGQSVFVAGTDPATKERLVLNGKITEIEIVANDGVTNSTRGFVVSDKTEFSIEPAAPNLTIKRTMMRKRNQIFKQDFNFQALGIGGLDKEFADIFRRAFASRVYPPDVVKQLGITHVRGLLLYGPPGTGKTLIARQIGKALRAKEPKIVNGPEVLNKFVGQSEENIRKLFADAEADEKKLGDASPLHIIIFDELDAICKQRGSVPAGAGVNDSIVNQLLSKIDGVDALNNILLIGMTNRLDMLDEALLRPGRLEVHIEIGLPDETGRLQILKIHTKSMSDAGRLGTDVSLEYLSRKTKNFSGAEISGLVRSATSFAFARNVDPSKLGAATDPNVNVTAADFELALGEVKPAFGVAEDALSKYGLYGIIPFSSAFDKLYQDMMTLTRQVRDSSHSPLVSVLLWGQLGSGKTSLAVEVARKSNFPFVKIISSVDFVGYHEAAKILSISKCFDDAYKSQLSVIILDDLERLVDYTPIGPRFSNNLLQALMVLIKKLPSKEGRRILVIGTTSEPSFIQDCGLLNSFQLTYNQPLIRSPDHLTKCLQHRAERMSELTPDVIKSVVQTLYGSAAGSCKFGVKKLFLALEMAKQQAVMKGEPTEGLTGAQIVQCLKDFGVSVQ